MLSLTEDDLLDLLGYTPNGRHPLEVLGFERSTRGAQAFRQERTDLFSQACCLITAVLEDAGSFPRQPSEEVLKEGVYLEQRADVVALHMSVEVGIGQTARTRVDYPTAREAIVQLLKRLGDPAYLAVPPSLL